MLTENFSGAVYRSSIIFQFQIQILQLNYLNTHILSPAFISFLYVGSMENSESFHVLISTSLPVLLGNNKKHIQCHS